MPKTIASKKFIKSWKKSFKDFKLVANNHFELEEIHWLFQQLLDMKKGTSLIETMPIITKYPKGGGGLFNDTLPGLNSLRKLGYPITFKIKYKDITFKTKPKKEEIPLKEMTDGMGSNWFEENQPEPEGLKKKFNDSPLKEFWDKIKPKEDTPEERQKKINEVNKQIQAMYTKYNMDPDEGDEGFWNAVEDIEKQSEEDADELRRLGRVWEDLSIKLT